MREDRDGVFWLGTNAGLLRFDPERETFERVAHDRFDPYSIGKGAIYDNPASGFIALQLSEPFAQNIDISLFDSRGGLVRRFLAATGQSIDIADLPAGAYALRAVAGERVFVGKFVRQ